MSGMNSFQPMFSFVATSRNDDHGGDVLRRTQSFINRLAEQCERHEVSAELIMVEWNPPPSRASLADVLGWPSGSDWFRATLLTVPRRLHLAHNYGSRLSLFQMIAKNVGIRRAIGDYCIATNIDIIFSDELFEWFKRGQFREGVLYRSDRWDIPNEIQLESDLNILLKRARAEAIRRNCVDGTYVKRDRDFVNSTTNRFDDAFYNPIKASLEDFRKLLLKERLPPREELQQRYDQILYDEMPRLRRNHAIPLLHTNGCGDFTMLSRRDWARLRGYPEWHIFSWTIDSVLLFQAHYNGLKIEELSPNLVHYHIEHDYGSGWTPEGAGSLWARMDQRGIPYMTYGQFTELVYELQSNAEVNTFTVYNDADWGLILHNVERYDIVTEHSPLRPPREINFAKLSEDFFEDLKPVELTEEFRPAEGAKLEFLEDHGSLELSVESSPSRWSYALELNLSTLVEQFDEYWVIMEVIVEAGSIGVGLLNTTRSDFVTERFLSVDEGWQSVIHAVNDSSSVSELVFRNTAENGRAARFRVRRFRIVSDWQFDDDLPESNVNEVAGLQREISENVPSAAVIKPERSHAIPA